MNKNMEKTKNIINFIFVIISVSFISWTYISVLLAFWDISNIHTDLEFVYHGLLYAVGSASYFTLLNVVIKQHLGSYKLGKYGVLIGIASIFIISFLLIGFVGRFDVTFVKGSLFQ